MFDTMHMLLIIYVVTIVRHIVAQDHNRILMHQRIIGGSAPDRDYVRSFVSISTYDRLHFCGGTLIHAQYVLTAAHCWDDDSPLFASIGLHSVRDNIEWGKSRIPIKRKLLYPDFSGMNTLFEHDIAILELKYPSGNPPVTLELKDTTHLEEKEKRVSIIGFGETENYGLSEDLKQVDLKLWGLCDCITEYQRFGLDFSNYNKNAHICTAHTQGKDSCRGDSGGPMFYGKRQIGIVSWGYSCAVAPGYYTRVSHYFDWILEVIGKSVLSQNYHFMARTFHPKTLSLQLNEVMKFDQVDVYKYCNGIAGYSVGVDLSFEKSERQNILCFRESEITVEYVSRQILANLNKNINRAIQIYANKNDYISAFPTGREKKNGNGSKLVEIGLIPRNIGAFVVSVEISTLRTFASDLHEGLQLFAKELGFLAAYSTKIVDNGKVKIVLVQANTLTKIEYAKSDFVSKAIQTVDCGDDSSARIGEGGRVEVKFRDVWGTVCDDWFDENEAVVFCNSLNDGNTYTENDVEVISSDDTPDGTGPIMLDDLRCTGSEDSLLFCMHTGIQKSDCTHTEDVGVLCKANLNVRLNDVQEVEVFVNGRWGSVCADHFDKSDAITVCKYLAKDQDVVDPNNVGYGHLNRADVENVVVSGLQCSGEESNIGHCKHFGLGNRHACPRDGAGVTVQCGFDVSKDRIAISTRLVQNRAEIMLNQEWKSICSEALDSKSALVFCNSLNDGFIYGEAEIISEAFVSRATESRHILDHKIDCIGNENNIAQCSIQESKIGDCNHSMDVGVSCIQGMRTKIAKMSKIAKVWFNDSWRPICSTNFTQREADVFCRSLEVDQTYTRAEIKDVVDISNKNTFLLENLKCTGKETNLSYCKSASVGDNSCESGKSLVIDCV